MSVQLNQYLILGVKLAFRKDGTLEGSTLDLDGEAWADLIYQYLDSAFEGIEHHNGLCVIDDGMEGKYTMVGRVIKKSSEGNMLSGPFSLDTQNEHADLIPLVKELIQAQFKIENPDVKMWFVTHAR